MSLQSTIEELWPYLREGLAVLLADAAAALKAEGVAKPTAAQVVAKAHELAAKLSAD